MAEANLTSLRLTKIRVDGGTQMRAELSRDVIVDLAEVLDDLPPAVVFYDGQDYWLADGFHRYGAHSHAARKHMIVEVQPGTRRDAILYAAGANRKHGLRRTNADKRRAVETLLRDEEWGQWSDREIARRCAVSHPLVAEIRAELSGNGFQIDAGDTGATGEPSEEKPATTERLVQRGGSTYPMNTEGLSGRTKEVAGSTNPVVSGQDEEQDPEEPVDGPEAEEDQDEDAQTAAGGEGDGAEPLLAMVTCPHCGQDFAIQAPG